MEATGLPVDVEALGRIRENRERIQQALIERVDPAYRVYAGGRFCPHLWAAWTRKNDIRWPRSEEGGLDLRLSTFKEMAKAYAVVRPMKELTHSLSLLREFCIAVGTDGRARCPLRPFASKTGRNQPKGFIFGAPAWFRGVVKPAEGM